MFSLRGGGGARKKNPGSTPGTATCKFHLWKQICPKNFKNCFHSICSHGILWLEVLPIKQRLKQWLKMLLPSDTREDNNYPHPPASFLLMRLSQNLQTDRQTCLLGVLGQVKKACFSSLPALFFGATSLFLLFFMSKNQQVSLVKPIAAVYTPK